jgi:regulator of ribosome biosynthesis
MEVLLAKDVAPAAFGGKSKRRNDDDENDDDDSNYEDDDDDGEDGEDVVDDLEYDVYNLTALNTHPFICNDENREEAIKMATERATQLLVKRIFSCEMEKSDQGPLAILPTETFIFPREKRIPEPKPETRWEKFAKTKGILKKKKERMVYDEVMKEWRPAFGYKRANSDVDDAIVEIKGSMDPYADPWEESRKNKKARVDKNIKNQVQNQVRAGLFKGKLGGKKTYDPVSVPGLPIDIDDSKSSSKRRGRDGVRRALELVQHSTQSMGRFDEMRRGEPKRQMQGRKRAFRDNLASLDSERAIMKSQIRIVEDKVQKKANGVTNSLKQYEGILPDAPSDSFKQTKGKNRVRKEGGGKKRK